MALIGYNDSLSPQEQIDAEEAISATIWNMSEQVYHDSISDGGTDGTLTPDDCNDIAKYVVYLVLRRFRPDLFDDYRPDDVEKT